MRSFSSKEVDMLSRFEKRIQHMDYIRPHPNPPLAKGRVPLGGWGYLSQTSFELVLVIGNQLTVDSVDTQAA